MEDLLPLYAESGITGWYPMERGAGNDLLKIRKEFPKMQLLGGFDKKVLFSNSSKEHYVTFEVHKLTIETFRPHYFILSLLNPIHKNNPYLVLCILLV